mgnify:CR=1 FL=1
MNKRGFWKGLFGKGKKKELPKDNQKNTPIKPTISKKKEIPNEIKVQKFDPKVQKEIYAEEMKLAKKVSKEFTKNYKEEPKKLVESSDNTIKEIRGKKVKNLKPEEKIAIGKKIVKGDGVSSGGEEVLKFNVAGFNELLMHGGLPIGSSILVEGGPGSGKTIFCLHLANDMCSQGKKVLYMSFEEPEDRLVSHMESFGFPAGKYVKDGTLIIMRFNALDIARSVEALSTSRFPSISTVPSNSEDPSTRR